MTDTEFASSVLFGIVIGVTMGWFAANYYWRFEHRMILKRLDIMIAKLEKTP